jgi:uncharacterized protein (TIGR02145 family)
MIKMMKKTIVQFIIVTLTMFYTANAQISINTDGTDPDSSAMLELKGNDRGFLPTRLTTAQILAINSPAEGLMVYNTDTKNLQVFDGTRWKSPGTGFVCGDQILDADSNIYNTVLIEDRCWTIENLKTTSYQNDTSILNVTDATEWSNASSGAFVWYDNDISWKEEYGALYNWYATVDTSGLCPTGWRVPTNDEWTALTDYIGGIGSPHGNELKSCRQVNSTSGGDCSTSEHPRWDEDSGNPGTDDYGFSGFPGGFRNSSGGFATIGGSGIWWSSVESTSAAAWSRGLNYNSGNVNEYESSKKDGLSVRCIRD